MNEKQYSCRISGWSLLAVLACWLLAGSMPGAEIPTREWTSTLLRDATAWPHPEKDAHVAVTPQGLRVEVAEGHRFAIAAASHLTPPKDLGRIRIRVVDVGGGAKWFVRLYGAMRQQGKPTPLGIAQDEAVTGERVFHLDQRARTQPDAPLQLQLGVEGEPGAYSVFDSVEFLPALQRANHPPRTSFQPGQKDIAAVELMPNLPEPYELIDWREKAALMTGSCSTSRPKANFCRSSGSMIGESI
jgi:hypothetical protein